MSTRLRRASILSAASWLLPVAAAYGSSSGGLPWEAPLDKIVKSLTGPVALGISILAMAAAGGALVFGGELSEFTRKIIILVLAISFLVFGTSFMSTIFGVSGALV